MPRQKLGTSRRRGGTNREPAGDGISIDNSDTRSPQQRFADGFVDAMRRVGLDGDLPAKGGDRPRVLVTVDFEHLKAGVGCGTMADTTDQLASPGTVRRLACDAQIIPIVLGGGSQILDQGRGCRTAQGPLRTAVRRYHAPHQLRGPRRVPPPALRRRHLEHPVCRRRHPGEHPTCRDRPRSTTPMPRTLPRTSRALSPLLQTTEPGRAVQPCAGSRPVDGFVDTD
ncbi:MAG: DUF222 domain-containing protein [Nocardioidaceae bacterium]